MATSVQRLIISVSELSRAVAFYVSAVGLEEKRRVPGFAVLSASGLEVLLHERPTVPSATAVSIGFAVGGLDRVVEAAVRLGGRVIDPPATQPWGERMAVLADPDGHIVCLSELSPTR